MKLADILNESTEDIINTLNNKCKATILAYRDNPGEYLFHNAERSAPAIAFEIRQDRRPLDSYQSETHLYNLVFEYKFKIPRIRSRVKFITTANERKLGYGRERYIAFPLDSATLIYDDMIHDSIHIMNKLVDALTRHPLIQQKISNYEFREGITAINTIDDFDESPLVEKITKNEFLSILEDLTSIFSRYKIKKATVANISRILQSPYQVEVMVFDSPRFYGINIIESQLIADII